MSTTKRPSIFSRLSSSSASIQSSSSTQPSIPKGSHDTVYARYAKDGKGYDFNLTYPYCTGAASSSSSSSTYSTSESDVPFDFKLRYAKDAKGHDFGSTYAYSPSRESSTTLVGGSDAVHADNKNMRYAWHQGRQAS
ncbi:uncharacterized protein Z520_02496 [Fonsecaea multimorphosa CBS 102226]|uniref:Uncharacterized protein n=1 Tax=Fonsecaea multimorphosa CBS 102226 TaxID=1442371 RepID=A0A0D2K8F5_9EURO|nr:uncharacterized protein Z520_02496 [Fonsecaea multimorphosa CBS 102226]KIY02358.1 hypothetical protein Z520_02496 [Fonsecaea multimorphosa CBS 102226]OAL29002.1 hypothetical protein AYO22_02438 [Fonsecaea multimorphosa]